MLLLFNQPLFNTQIEDSSRSGYWRLFYYNLQAEELKKNEQKQGKEKKERTIQGPQIQSVEALPRSRRKVEVVEEWVPPVLPKPLYRAYEKIELPNITPYLNVISMEFRNWITESEPFFYTMLAKEADNDEEYDVEMLLLSA